MPTLEQVLAAQHRVITSAQAQACGISRDVIATRVRHGEWQRELYRTYAVHPREEPPHVVRCRAALLYAGSGGAISHGTVLDLLARSDGAHELVHVTLSGRVVASTPGLAVHRVADLGPIGFVRDLPSVSPPAAVVGAWSEAESADDAAAVLCRAVIDLKIPVGVIQAEMSRPVRIRRRRQLEEACRLVGLGCHSVLEMQFYRAVELAFRLPSGLRQQVIRVASGRTYRVDVVYAGHVVVELDGRQHWATAEARHADLLRDAELPAAGYVVLRFTSRDVRERPGWCAAAVRAAVAAAA